MAIEKEEFMKEEENLTKVNKQLDKVFRSLEKEIFQKEEELLSFKKLNWEQKSSFDSQEFNQVMAQSDQEAFQILSKRAYFKKLNNIKTKPYFASFIYEEDNKTFNIYMALTYLRENETDNILYDWRSPICSIFYDFENGPCQYQAPGGIFKGTLKRKRQYKIENNKLIHIFDNSINIDDEVLQEVLANNSSEKMKNVVNTIQKDQNRIIRNVEDRNLIVQGIAGSGKTSVALHRIAFLLYRIKNLNSNNVLIFSPNDIFTEYISNVLPELGEDNTLQTTFSDYLSYFIKEYKKVESFTNFIERYYKDKSIDYELIKYKQSKEIIKDVDLYLENYIKHAKCINSFGIDKFNFVDKDDVNDMLHSKFNKFPFFERIDEISKKLSLKHYGSPAKKRTTIARLIKGNSNFKKDYKEIYYNFYKSEFTKIKIDDSTLKRTKNINYEDALLFAYMKGKLEGFTYEYNIKQVLVDEAQDYNYLQYYIMKQIFKKADFTILGDVNQNINPYFSYNSLEELNSLFTDSIYLELLKTYRSSKEIIEYTNKILNLGYVSAIRKENNIPVVEKEIDKKIKETLTNDITHLKSKYNSLAIITKNLDDAIYLYNQIKEDINISLVDTSTTTFKKDLIIIPAYLAKGLEFDSVILYKSLTNPFLEKDKNLLYVACTRAQHELYVYKEI